MSAPASTACQTGWTPCTTNAPSRRRCLRSDSRRMRLISGFAALLITSAIALRAYCRPLPPEKLSLAQIGL